MIKVKLIVLGKLKESFFVDAANEYIKRLSRFCQLEVLELSDFSVPESPTQKQVEALLHKEAQQIIKQIKPNMHVVSLCVEGKQLDSIEFSEYLTKIEKTFGGSVAFIIGSSHGLCDDIKALSHFHLSFSKMTYPHQLMRIILLEQLYRGFKIKNNESYHK